MENFVTFELSSFLPTDLLAYYNLECVGHIFEKYMHGVITEGSFRPFGFSASL